MKVTATDVVTFLMAQWSWLPALPAGATLEGRTVILTGANSGIGYEAAHQLASLRPAKLILACRNLKTGAEALDSVLRSHPGTRAEVWELDLASFASVKAFAVRAERELERVDVAFLNAGINPGIVPKPMQITEDGHELTHQINVLATVLLGLLLVPLLVRSDDPALVITSSEVHAWADTDIIAGAVQNGKSIVAAFDDPGQYDNEARYPQSKKRKDVETVTLHGTAPQADPQLLLQFLVRRLLPLLPVRLVSLNPGLCRSNINSDFPTGARIGMNVMGRPASRGARILTSAAFSPDSAEYWHVGAPCAAPSAFMATKTGVEAGRQYFAEVLEVLEEAVPGSTKVVRGDK